jgi:hypothetical protein
MNLDSHIRDVKHLLTDPVRLVTGLGWGEGAKRQSRGLIIRCPAHGERNPSCSVRVAQDGMVSVKCFACQWSGDVLTCIAQAYGLRLNQADDFREALALGAELGGDHALADEIRGGRKDQARKRQPVPAPAPLPETPYPDQAEVQRLWSESGSIARDSAAAATMMERGLDPSVVEDLGLARLIGPQQWLPTWARYGNAEKNRERTWFETGHVILIRTWDHTGTCRGVRAWRLARADSHLPKRLPPKERKASGLVLANRAAVQMLRRQLTPLRVICLEGEPDFLTWATRAPDDAVIGLMSGGWSSEFAKKIPDQAEVVIRTHQDDAGQAYAKQITDTVGERCRVWVARG